MNPEVKGEKRRSLYSSNDAIFDLEEEKKEFKQTRTKEREVESHTQTVKSSKH